MPDSVQIIINVDAGSYSTALAESFISWLDGQGEQDFPAWANESLDLLIDFSYDYPNNQISIKGYTQPS